MLPLCTAFIFLCAPFSIDAQSVDSYARLALAAERDAYASQSAIDFNAALWRKLDCQKQAGWFDDALASLARMKPFALSDQQSDRYYYEQTLCAFLSGDYPSARIAAEQGAAMIADSVRRCQNAMVGGLAAAAEGDWRAAQTQLTAWAESSLPPERAEAFGRELRHRIKKAPHMKNPEAAYYLSLLPGAGQLYAAAPKSSVVAAMANLGLIAYITLETIGGYYWTAWFVGAGLLSNTYFVNMERARELTRERNVRVSADFNSELKTMVLDAAEGYFLNAK